jgi:two-component system response regulator
VRADPRTKQLPVVIPTSSKEGQDLIKGYGLGTNNYIRESVDFVQLAEAVRQLKLYWLVLNKQPPAKEVLDRWPALSECC